MFTMKRNEWIVCLSIAAVLELIRLSVFRRSWRRRNVKESVSFFCPRLSEAYLVKIGERGQHLLHVVRVLKNSCPVLLFHNGHFIYQVFRSCKLINNK